MRTPRSRHLYDPVLSSEDGSGLPGHSHKAKSQVLWKAHRSIKIAVMCSVIGFLILGLLLTSIIATPAKLAPNCDSVERGFQCQPEISQVWGQYSPYYSVPSEIPAGVPDGCQISFVQLLSRHGARNPTASKSASYNVTIQKIKKNVSQFSGAYAFLENYEYTLGADQLTTFGQQEMVNSGYKFYTRYKGLARHLTPFIRSSGQARVVESAQNFTLGYHQARLADKVSTAPDGYQYPMTVISEADGSNNTLSHGLCTDFEHGPDSGIASNAQKTWQAIFTPPITARLNAGLKGANLDASDTISMMDLCPFDTVACAIAQISPFCDLFTETEWREYDYYQSLNKYYGYSHGNPLGPTQGVGFTNELIARMTNKPVEDHTSVNHTLDEQPANFPIGVEQVLYADFSHDNDMTAIFSAMGLYNSTSPLSNTSIESTTQTRGYSASWTVPFAARAYFEKMTCRGEDEELVRILVNDRVLPLTTCVGDVLGRCTLDKFIGSLGFAMQGGNWDRCFI